LRKAVYPGTFDPITRGHIDIIERGIELFDELIITIAINADKNPLFSVDERIEMIENAVKDFDNVQVTSTRGLIVDFAAEEGAIALLRGLRYMSDFEYEFQMAWMNRHLNENITTMFLMPHRRYTHLNSTVLREVAKLGGNIDTFVTPMVAKRIKQKFHITT